MNVYWPLTLVHNSGKSQNDRLVMSWKHAVCQCRCIEKPLPCWDVCEMHKGGDDHTNSPLLSLWGSRRERERERERERDREREKERERESKGDNQPLYVWLALIVFTSPALQLKTNSVLKYLHSYLIPHGMTKHNQPLSKHRQEFCHWEKKENNGRQYCKQW